MGNTRSFSHGMVTRSLLNDCNASTSEGIFWETINAAAVLGVPMAVSVWDDGYGISVPNEYQTAKGSISEALMDLIPLMQRTNGPSNLQGIRRRL